MSYSKMLGISLFGALERTHCWKSVDVVVVKHYDLLGKIRELYVTSGFSSGTHNSCRLICLRFNPVKMSKWKRHFLFYILLVELVTKGVFKLLWILVFSRLKLKIAQLKKIFFFFFLNGSDFVASHMFLSATAWDLGRSLFEKKRLSNKIVWWSNFLTLFLLAGNKVLICFFGCWLKRHFGFLCKKTFF